MNRVPCDHAVSTRIILGRAIRENSHYSFITGSYSGKDAYIQVFRKGKFDSGKLQALHEHASQKGPDRFLLRTLAVAAAEGMVVWEKPKGVLLSEKAVLPGSLGPYLDLVFGLCRGFSWLHKAGRYHLCLMPENILIHHRTRQPRLWNYGMLRPIDFPEASQDLCGKDSPFLPYLAPEQFGRINRKTDHRSDIYSLGVICYETAFGRLPIQGGNLAEWIHGHSAQVPDLPRGADFRLPAMVGRIILKMLAKEPDDRYQTCEGIIHDLEKCRAQSALGRRTGAFVLGRTDVSAKIQWPQKLYGRDSEKAELEVMLERAARGGMQIALIKGEAGSGKTALVHEVLSRKTAAMSFIEGKALPESKGIPYSSWIHALKQLIGLFQGESASDRAAAGRTIRAGLGEGTAVLAEMIPEAREFTGDLDAPPTLDPSESQSRLHAMVERLIRAFTTSGRGLVLFLDDLQWSDSASLDLFRHLTGVLRDQPVLLAGAFREAPDGPDRSLGDQFKGVGTKDVIHEFALSSLSRASVESLLREALSIGGSHSRNLTRHLYQSTQGNALRLRETVLALSRENILCFHPKGGWSIDFVSLEAGGKHRDISHVLRGWWKTLSKEERRILEPAACLRSPVKRSFLAHALRLPESLLNARLEKLFQEGIVRWREGLLQFTHDAMRETLAAQMPPERKRALHRFLGEKLELWSEDTPSSRFEIVYHLVEGLEGDAPLARRRELAEWNLTAGRAAKNAASFEAGLAYFRKGMELAGEKNAWILCRNLAFELTLGIFECELNLESKSSDQSDLASVRTGLPEILGWAESIHDRRRVYETALKVLTRTHRSGPMFQILKEALGTAGMSLPAPEENLAALLEEELRTFFRNLRGTSVAAIRDAGELKSEQAKAITSFLSLGYWSMAFVDPLLMNFINLRMANTFLKEGNNSDSPMVYLHVAMLLVDKSDMALAKEFSDLSYALQRKFPNPWHGIFFHSFYWGFLSHWWRPYHACLPHFMDTYRKGREIGELHYSFFSLIYYFITILAQGKPIAYVLSEFERLRSEIESTPNPVYKLYFLAIFQRAQALSAPIDGMLRMQAPEFQEELLLEKCATSMDLLVRDLSTNAHYIAYYSGRFQVAREFGQHIDKTHNFVFSSLFYAEYRFFAYLTLAALYQGMGLDEKAAALAELQGRLENIRVWAGQCPENFSHRHHLAEAEMYRILGRNRDAEKSYLAAVEASRREGFLNIEALANELAGRFYMALGKTLAACAVLREAVVAYKRWGALAKAVLLETEFPEHIRSIPVRSLANPTIAAEGVTSTTLSRVDLEAVLKSSWILSAETEHTSLVALFLKIAMENAGAESGCILVEEDGALIPAACGSSLPEGIRVESDPGAEAGRFPPSITSHVLGTGETVLLEDAHAYGNFQDDVQVSDRRIRSVLACPLRFQGRTLGLLYLENNQLSGAFTPDRKEMVALLASQAAISLQNARYHGQLRNLAGRLQRVREEEKAALAREVHDELGQSLTGLRMDADWVVRKSPSSLVRKRAENMAERIDESIDRVRRIARDLRPGSLDHLGMAGAFRQFIRDFERRSGIRCRADLEEGLDAEGERPLALYRILQEALTNVARHSGARNAWIILKGEGSRIHLDIRDDGKGISAESLSHPSSIGLTGMRERVRALHGFLRIQGGPGEGTRVETVLPGYAKEKPLA